MGTRRQKLANILNYHIVKGRIKTSNLKDGQTLKAINGEKLKVTKHNGTVKINGAKIVHSDIKATNGYIQVINKVLTPSSKK
jgi:uncharacterized surface protein with fasciclin (FAS1) repeats